MRLRKTALLLAATLAFSGASTINAQAAQAAPPSLEVVKIQHTVVKAGCSVGRWGADGRMGPATKEAIKCFQRKMGLADDGIVGPITRAALERYATSRGLPKPVWTQATLDLLSKTPRKALPPEQQAWMKQNGFSRAPERTVRQRITAQPRLGPRVTRPKETYVWKADLEHQAADVTWRMYVSPQDIRKYNIHAGEGTAVFIFAICGRWPSIAAQGLCGAGLYAHLGPLKRTLMLAQMQGTCARITFTDVPPLIRSRQEKCKWTDGKTTWTP